MTTLNTHANEQMREKAQLVFADLPFDGKEMMLTGKARVVLESRILNAIREAHAAGRQEILDRLPSEDEVNKISVPVCERMLKLNLGEYTATHNGVWAAFDAIKSRLTGEST